MNEYYWEDKEPNLREFKTLFDDYCNEILTSNTADPKINSHNIIGEVRIDCVNTEDEYEIVGLDIGQLIGCGCWSDIIIQIKKVNQ